MKPSTITLTEQRNIEDNQNKSVYGPLYDPNTFPVPHPDLRTTPPVSLQPSLFYDSLVLGLPKNWPELATKKMDKKSDLFKESLLIKIHQLGLRLDKAQSECDLKIKVRYKLLQKKRPKGVSLEEHIKHMDTWLNEITLLEVARYNLILTTFAANGSFHHLVHRKGNTDLQPVTIILDKLFLLATSPVLFDVYNQERQERINAEFAADFAGLNSR